jgi:hypothetical protein
MILLVVGSVVVGSCGGGDDSVVESDQPGSVERELDRCSLISEAEAESWMGPGVTAGPAEGFDGEPDLVTCLYEVEGAFNSVLVQVYDGEVYFAEPGSPSRTGEDLAGLGEDAWTKPGDVNFLQNDWTVSVSRISGQATDAALLEMAEMISSRLP